MWTHFNSVASTEPRSPKNPDPSKITMLRTPQNTPAKNRLKKRFQWRPSLGILTVPWNLISNRFPQPETSSPFLKVMIQHDNDLVGSPKIIEVEDTNKAPLKVSCWVQSISIPYLSQFEIGSSYKGATGGFLNNDSNDGMNPPSAYRENHSDRMATGSFPTHAGFFPPIGYYPGSNTQLKPWKSMKSQVLSGNLAIGCRCFLCYDIIRETKEKSIDFCGFFPHK